MSDGYYDEYPEIEDELNAALAESLHPRSPGHVNDVIADLGIFSRMLREPDRYIDRFGRPAYDIKLADAQWHVFRMLGKLSNHIHVLAPA